MNFKDIMNKDEIYISRIYKTSPVITKPFALPSWLHRASNNVENLSLPTDAHNVKKHRVIKTF